MSVIQRLRQVARPFVVRQLRGPRARRALGLSAVLGVVTVLLGMWLALGRGELEREVRQGLRLEQSSWDRVDRELVIVCHGGCSNMDASGLRIRILAELRDALRTYDPVRDQAFADLHARAQEEAHQLRGLHHELETGWDWRDPRDRQRLAIALDMGLKPRIEVYESPLGTADAIGFVGMLATFGLVLLGTLFGPVLTAIAVAQESHENTLPPITGTGLGGRDIVAGLVIAAFAPVAIVAAPQMLLALVASIFVGDPFVVLGVVALIACCAWALAMTGAIVGLYVGRRRGPGPVGIIMLGLTSVWLLVGMAIGFSNAIGNAEVGSIISAPSSALVLGAREAFFSMVRMSASSGPEIAALCIVPAIAAVVLGALAFRAAARRVDDRVVSPLTRGEAVLATLIVSLVCTLTALVATAERPESGGLPLGTLAMLVLPLAALLVARVPATQGETRRDIDLPTRMLELAAFTGVHFGVLLLLSPASLLLAAEGLLHATWAVAVTGLTALRLLSPGNRWLVGTWGGFCLLSAAIMMVNGAELVREHSRGEMFALFEVSPVLGTLQVVFVVAIPLLLVHGIRRAART